MKWEPTRCALNFSAFLISVALFTACSARHDTPTMQSSDRTIRPTPSAPEIDLPRPQVEGVDAFRPGLERIARTV